ncbi:MAG: 4Fe-4S dicluster domain-containing protein [Acidobacteriota bacterium]
MALRIDSTVLPEMKRFGAFDIDACFNCGNCTAVCPLSEHNDAFPRRMIRYAQLGRADHIAASKELWLCYYCAECSDTCPRQAEPGEFMASARRYAISRFDPTTFARRLYRSKPFAATALVALFVVFVAVLLAGSPGLPSGRPTSQTLLEFVPFEVIHWLGLGVIIAMALVAIVTVLNMFWMMSRIPTPGDIGAPAVRPERFPFGAMLVAAKSTLAEIFGQRRYRDCGTEKPADPPPLPLRRWFVHYSIMMGMVGLALATVLDYLVKTPGSYVPIWYPIRLLGTIAGIFLVYGASVVIVQRLRRSDKYHSYTPPADWVFLFLLWAIGVSGFLLEIAEYAPLGGTRIDIVFLVHIALAMELILLLPFTKFAHIVYRPAAIWFTEFRRLRAAQVQ